MTEIHDDDRPVVVPVPVVVPAREPSAGPANRLTRSMMELVVGASRLPAAEKVAGVGASIAEFVGTPVRRMLEPALENRSDAATDARDSLLELIRVVVQEAIELVDINAILERVDIGALMQRIDVGKIVERVDVGEIIEQVDVDEIVKRVDIAGIIRRVDVNALMEQVDVNELMTRVDVEALLTRIDINQLMEQVDLDGIVQRTEIGSLIARSTGGVATTALDGVRSRAVGVDGTVARVVDRILRREPGPPGPGLPAPVPNAPGPMPEAPA